MDRCRLFKNIRRTVPPRAIHKRSKTVVKKRNFPVRVFVCGPHGAGKTTLMERYTSTYPNCEMREEMARKFLTERGETAEDIDPTKYPKRFEDFQRSILEAQCKLEERDEQVKGVIIYDRGPDALVYITRYHPDGERIRQSMLEEDGVRRAIRRYRRSLILLLKPQRDFGRKDGVRMDSSFEDVEHLFACFRGVLQQLHVPYRIVSDADLHTRIKTMARLISKFQRKMKRNK